MWSFFPEMVTFLAGNVQGDWTVDRMQKKWRENRALSPVQPCFRHRKQSGRSQPIINVGIGKMPTRKSPRGSGT
jgi:hypothetical protein